METEARIQSTIDAYNQIEKQQQECHYTLHNARARKSGVMKLDGFQDFDLLYGEENAKQKLSEAINGEVKSTVYVKVTYDAPNHYIHTLGYFTWEEFQNIPKDWMGFKRFKTAYEKKKEKEAKEAYNIQQKTMPIMGNEEISELDPRQLVYVSEGSTIEDILQKYPNREAYSMGNLRGATIVFKTQKNETMYDWKYLKRVR